MKKFEDLLAEKYDLRPEDVAGFMEYLRPVEVTKNRNLIEKGVFNDNFCLIRKGIIRAYIPDVDGEQTLWFGYPGQTVFNVWCYHYGSPSPITIEAVTACELYCITKEDLENLCENSHVACNIVRKILTGHAAEAEESFTSLFECDRGMERYLAVLKRHPELLQNVPLKKLASYIHLAPQSLSRIRSQIK